MGFGKGNSWLVAVQLAAACIAVASAANAPVCEDGLYSTYDQVRVFNSSIAANIIPHIKPDFNGTVFVATEDALNNTLFEVFLTPFNFTGPLPLGFTAGQLLARFLPELAKYHVLPGIIVDPAKPSKSIANQLENDGFAYLGPYTTDLQNNTFPIVPDLCNISKEADPPIYGKDIYVQIFPSESGEGYDTTILSQGTNSPVKWSYTTCGGVVHVLDQDALLPCFPNATRHESTVIAILDEIYKANNTYYKKLKNSADMASGSQLLAVTASVLAFVASSFWL